MYKISNKFFYTLLILPIIGALSPFLFGRSVFFHIDFITQHLPYFYFFKQSIVSGNNFLWNPDVFSGFSGFASYNHVFLTPWSVFLLYFVSPWTAYVYSVFFMLALMGVCMAALMRYMGISRWGAVTGSIVFVFSQWMLIYDLPIVNTFYILPLLFLSLLLFFKRRHKWMLVVGMVSVGLGLASGHWQFMIEIFSAAGVFAVYLGLRDTKFWRVPLAYASMIIVGVALSLPKLIPAIVFLQNSVRNSGVGHGDAVRAGFTLFDPLRLFMPFDIAFLGFAPEHFTYVGAMVPLLFVLGFSFRKEGYAKFFSWFFLIALVLSVKYSPLYWVLHHAPIFNITRHAERWGLLMFFAASVLVGFGVDVLWNNFENIKNSARIKILIRIYGTMVMVATMVGLVSTYLVHFYFQSLVSKVYFLFDRYAYSKTSGALGLDYYHAYIQKNILDVLSNFDLVDPRSFFALIFLVGAYFLCRSIARSKHITRSRVALFVVANIVLVFPFLGRTVSIQALTDKPMTASVLHNTEQTKVFDFLVRKGTYEQIELPWRDVQGQSLYNVLTRYYVAAAYPNTGILNGFRSAALYDTIMARPMARLLAYIGSERSEFRGDKLSGLPVSTEEKMNLLDSRIALVRFLGITHITTPYEFTDTSPFHKILQQSFPNNGSNLFVYEILNSRPRYYFTDETWLIDMDNNATDPAVLQSIIEAHAPVITQRGIVAAKQKNTEMYFETDREQEQLLVVSQNNLPGWRAWIDGAEIPIHTFGTVFQALYVPPGKHVVVLRYEYSEIIKYFFKNNFGITL